MKILVILCILLLTAGCANPTKGMTPAEKADYKIEKKFAMLERRAERHDKLRGSKESCKARGLVWWINGHAHFSSFEIRRMDRDPSWFPNDAGLGDFACVTGQEAIWAIERMIGGY